MGITSWKFQGDSKNFWQVTKIHDLVEKSEIHIYFFNFHLNIKIYFHNR